MVYLPTPLSVIELTFALPAMTGTPEAPENLTHARQEYDGASPVSFASFVAVPALPGTFTTRLVIGMA